MPGTHGTCGGETIVGPQGPPGDVGVMGPKGDKGDRGDTGNTGSQGSQGIQGIPGNPLSVAAAWPVGSIFLSAVSTSPATLLGIGTWAQIGQGQMLVGYKAGDADFGTLGATGGTKTVSHAAHANGAVTRGASGVTVNNHGNHVHAGSGDHTNHVHSDSHTHNIAHTHGVSSKPGTATAAVKDAALGVTQSGDRSAVNTGNNTTALSHGNTGNETTALTHTVVEPNAGAGHDHSFTQPSTHADHNILNPFLVVYLWQRTA